MKRQLFACLLVVASVACSSTSNTAKRTADEGGPAASAAAGTNAPAGSDAGGPSSAIVGGSNATGGTAASTTAGTDVTAARPGASRKLSGELQIGISFINDAATVFGAFGVTSPGAQDTSEDAVRKLLQPLIDHINATGGLGGRKLVPVYHGVASLRGSFEQQSQEMCVAFTEDNHVFAVLNGALVPSFAIVDCLARKHTPMTWQFQHLVDDPAFDRYGKYLYMPWGFSADRLGVFVDRLVARRFFGTKPKIGVLRYDDALSTRFMDKIIEPRIKAHGMSVAVDYAIAPPSAAGDAGAVAAALSNAVIRFKTEGVTHVLFLPTDGVLSLLYGPIAENQDYHGIWGLTSLDIPAQAAANASANQLDGATAVGWIPDFDTSSENDLPKGNAKQDLCIKLLRPGAGDQAAGALRFCDGLFFLQDALAKAPSISVDGLRVGAESLGSHYQPAWTFKGKLGPGRHDGAAAVRDLVYNTSCTCFRYASREVPVP